MNELRSLWACLCVIAAVASGGCDECIGSSNVVGVVTDGSGAPLEGATVSQCWYADASCRATTTGADGRFRLDVQLDGPASDDGCVLRPISISHAGCEDLTIVLPASSSSSEVDAGTIALTCTANP